MQAQIVEYDAHEIICREGDLSADIYCLVSGKLLVCTIQGTQVKAIARIGPGEFFGELSFFDGKPRAGHVVTLEESRIVTFPQKELGQMLPVWYQEVHKSLTKKIRLLDEVIHLNSLRRFSTEEQKPLTIEEQRLLFNLVTHQNN